MRITEVEQHDVTLEFNDWHADALFHFHGSGNLRRTVVVVHTDNGLEGLGEGRVGDDVIDKYIGTDPFDWLADDTSLPLGKAMYDLMGKHLGIPAHKLFGRKVRDWVPMGSWTVSQPPDAMADEIRHFAEMGYTWRKYHTSVYQNVLEQTAAMQEVAPPGFKIHYDLNGGRTSDDTLSLTRELAKFPIAGLIEDPMDQSDLEGYRLLREQSPLPIMIHGTMFDLVRELRAEAADGYGNGHYTIAEQIRRAGLLAGFNRPFWIQNGGGALTRSFLAQMSCTFPTATAAHYTDGNVWKSDIVNEQFEVVNGYMKVPDKPGLSVTLNRDELERLKALPTPKCNPFIVRCRYGDGPTMHFIHDPENARNFLCIPDLNAMPQGSYADPVTTDYWHDDGTAAFADMFERCRQGPVRQE